MRRSNLDGSNVVTLVPAGGTYTPKQMRVDPPSGKLYWSDREGMRVQRSNVDGSSVETLVTTGTAATDRMDESRWCVGMAIDTAGGWFYWTQKGGDNAGVGSIRRAHIQMPAGQTSTNRTDIEILFSGLPEPIDLELDLEAGMIYWADRGDDTINRAPIAIPAGATAANRDRPADPGPQRARGDRRGDRQAPRPPVLHRRERPARAREPGRQQQAGDHRRRRVHRHRRRRSALPLTGGPS